MGLFAIDVMAGCGAHPLLVIAAPKETEDDRDVGMEMSDA